MKKICQKRFASLINTNVKDYYKDYVELRSDVKTIPTEKMKQAVFEYNFGDDMFDEDPTVKLLEKKLADKFRLKNALFCASGTMANMVALNTFTTRGQSIILGERSHISKVEKPNVEFFGFDAIRLNNLEDGTIQCDSKYLESKLVPIFEDKSKHITVIALEDTHNFCSGQVLKQGFRKEYEDKLKPLFDKYDRKMPVFHLDGSRIFNSAVAQNTEEYKLIDGYRTVNICLSKGIAAPIGSVLLFRYQEDYEKARPIRRLLGGAMRQAGFIAAPALVALEDYRERMQNDHKNAKQFETLILKGTKKLHVRLPSQSNIVNLYFKEDKRSLIPQLVQQLRENHKVLVGPYPENIRAVFHHQVESSKVEFAANAIISEVEKLF